MDFRSRAPRAWQGLRATSVRTGTAPGFTYTVHAGATVSAPVTVLDDTPDPA